MNTNNYNSIYLEYMMKNLGEAFDYAFNSYNLEMDKFMDLFIASGYSTLFERCNINIILGMSGAELVLNVFQKTNFSDVIKPTQNKFDYSPYYWCGWILAYYQYKTSQSFEFIHSQITMKEILNLYESLHQANEEKFVEIVNNKIKDNLKSTRIQYFRKLAGLTQKELADKSGVNLRTLQQYELGVKNINKASAISIYNLAKALNCKFEDILELI